MTIKEMFDKSSAKEIADIIIKNNYVEENYDLNKLISNIQMVLDEFKNITPKYTDENKDFTVIVLKEKDVLVSYKEIPEEFFCVYGIHLNQLLENQDELDCTFDELMKKPQVNIINYGIEFMPRNELATLNICDLSFDKFGFNEVCAEVLWEITFYGWQEKTIEEKKEEILERVSETDKNELVNIDEALNELGYKEERTEEEIQKELEYSMNIGRENRIVVNNFYKEYLKKYLNPKIVKEDDISR